MALTKEHFEYFESLVQVARGSGVPKEELFSRGRCDWLYNVGYSKEEVETAFSQILNYDFMYDYYNKPSVK